MRYRLSLLKPCMPNIRGNLIFEPWLEIVKSTIALGIIYTTGDWFLIDNILPYGTIMVGVYQVVAVLVVAWFVFKEVGWEKHPMPTFETTTTNICFELELMQCLAKCSIAIPKPVLNVSGSLLSEITIANKCSKAALFQEVLGAPHKAW